MLRQQMSFSPSGSLLSPDLAGKRGPYWVGGGLRKCEDIGDIVFSLVGAGYIRKREADRKEDFQGSYNFDEAFPEN